jgi:hypothetical protein
MAFSAMTATITVTGKTAGAETVTAKAITGVGKLTFDFGSQGVLSISSSGGSQKILDIGMDSLSTLTCTITNSGTSANFAFVTS